MPAFQNMMSWMTPLFVSGFLFSATLIAQAQESTPAPAPKQDRPEIQWNIPDRPAIPNVEHYVLHSTAMGTDMGYNVYLPPGYEMGKKRYPVVYFLHGAGGTENSDAGGFSGLLAREIEAGHIAPVICVFPNGGMSGYRDHPEQKIMMETFLVQELIPQIDKSYRTITKREGRAVCGFSMGGGGSMRLAVKHPDLFCAAASWAAALGNRSGTNDSSELLRQNADSIKKHPLRLLLVVGDKDLTYSSHAPFLKTLDELKLPYTYHELPGVDHSLGVYYDKTGEELADFVAGFKKGK